MTAKEQRMRELRGGSPDQSRQPEDLFLKDRPNSFPIARLNTSSVPRNSAALTAMVRRSSFTAVSGRLKSPHPSLLPREKELLSRAMTSTRDEPAFSSI